jgi:hypothetical protein
MSYKKYILDIIGETKFHCPFFSYIVPDRVYIHNVYTYKHGITVPKKKTVVLDNIYSKPKKLIQRNNHASSDEIV